ncbi:RIP metalloprotease [Rhodococcus sp. ABRD24]|uniref:M50 family metallopeptidase n=1 Tax=Rhodococcus sp. ABRD24 TaxID=2507582 RepID=UPI00103C7D2F|nr:site-2 protease family protein [Rhodococcus sp. ABRD24]QBJ98047.1 RIP metalloprotease [Rhodococcus sp. ABRD24]
MVFVIGVVAFALGITLSIALHEAGHMWTAKALGMKVRRYYIGFGPKIFSFRRGETEFGLKAIPAGGFCDIAGMTAIDELAPDEVDRAMYKQKAWKRIVVMSGGIAMNFALGLVLVFILAVGWGLPNLNRPPETALGLMSCTPAAQNADGTGVPCDGEGPAQQAGLQRGDVVTAVGGVPVATWDQFQAQTQAQTGPTEFTIERGGVEMTVTVVPQQVQRNVTDSVTGQKTERTVGAIGVGQDFYEPVQYNALSAIPASVAFTSDMFVMTAERLVQMPSKVNDLWHSVTGGERDEDTPISVVGASVIGGQVAERGLWEVFIVLLASLNFFLGMFNLLPLLPLDGGHIAVTIYEKIRNSIRRLRGMAAGAPVDYMKLMPITWVFVVIGGAFMLLTLTADIVNPIQLFP